MWTIAACPTPPADTNQHSTHAHHPPSHTPRPTHSLPRWVLFVDERNVPHSSADSNYGATVEEFLRRVREGQAGGARMA